MTETANNDVRVSCSLCGRKFNTDRLSKHIEICEKQKKNVRKVFDSSKQRSVTDENGVPIIVSQQSNVPPPKKKSRAKSIPATVVEEPQAKPNWRAKHEEFIRTVRAARGESVDEPDEGAKRVPIGYVECPSCGRSFTKGAADRHIPWCKEQKARIPRSPVSNDAMAKFKARSQYKAPLKRTETRNIDSVLGSGYNNSNGFTSSAASVGSGRRSVRNSSPTRKGSSGSQKTVAASRVKARLEQQSTKKAPKTPIMKFKEKFPNHSKSSPTNDYIQQADKLHEILKRPNTLSDSNVPRTVPGVRIGGMSPVKPNNFDDDEITRLKSRLEEMYVSSGLNGKRYPTPANGVVSKSFTSEVDTTTRESTSGSSDGSAATASRANSSEVGGNRSNNGLPRFCHQCGTKYPITAAKYCYECGARRLGTVGSLITS
ncbi:hypothetical protein B4U80_04632 [Leptotrombidium deliense]|uniref:C2HC/C3H-type domain-containing protein n=1 Tax=Leptotrombidium deliense TaxID=299467 RepID=A0A443SVH6_9ACAR|nr:hypothetical protein B4U80_04632 [Leptotrombidium deliense]